MKKLLMTGATGFVGRNILPLLAQQYEVTTCGRNCKNMIQTDLSKEIPSISMKYDVVLHAAGKAHTNPRSDAEIKEYYDVNYKGTVNLCSSLEKVGTPESLIFISTVAVYGCDNGENIDESHALDAPTPYARSKKKAEAFLTDWCFRHQVKLAIVRPSLIAGPNPPGNLGAMIKGIDKGRYLSIGGGRARRSILMVKDIARLVPLLENSPGIYNICSDNPITFRDLEKIICKQLCIKLPMSIPLWLAKILACVGEIYGKSSPYNLTKYRKMSKSLTFSNMKAKRELAWEPINVIENFIIM